MSASSPLYRMPFRSILHEKQIKLATHGSNRIPTFILCRTQQVISVKTLNTFPSYKCRYAAFRVMTMQSLVNAVFFIFVVCAGGLVALASSVAVPGEPVLVLSIRGIELRENLVLQSGGRLIGLAAAPLASLAVSSDPAFIRRLRSTGTVLVLDGRAIAQLCGALN